MKIGFLGNANNYPFLIANAMRKQGHQVAFIVSNHTALDRPESRYPELRSGYPAWIHDIQFGLFDWILPTASRRRAVSILNGCDGVILNQFGPSIAYLLDKPAVALLTGSDLNVYCDKITPERFRKDGLRRPRVLRHAVGKAILQVRVSRQRQGVEGAMAVNYFPRGVEPVGDSLLEEMGITSSRRLAIMMSPIDELELAVPPCNGSLRIFCGARFNWVRPIPDGFQELDYKGSDRMIKGLAAFVRETGLQLDLRFVKKGLHVTESMALVHELGLDRMVTWCDELSQEAFLDECRMADIVFDQLDRSVVGMAGLDAMALGRPVIANGRPEIFLPLTGVESPICQASSSEEVVVQLRRLACSRDERVRIGLASREYVTKYFSVGAGAAAIAARFGR